MNSYDHNDLSSIRRRLQPITLCVQPTKLDIKRVQGERNKILTYTQRVAIAEVGCNAVFTYGKLLFHSPYDDNQIVYYPPMDFIPDNKEPDILSQSECEMLPCVYDPVGFIKKETATKLVSYHALMPALPEGVIFSCFALLKITMNLSKGTEKRSIVPASECPDVFFGKYATDYFGLNLCPLEQAPESKSCEFSVLYIGKTPVCARNKKYNEYITLREYYKK